MVKVLTQRCGFEPHPVLHLSLCRLFQRINSFIFNVSLYFTAVIWVRENWGVLIEICINLNSNLLYYLFILCNCYINSKLAIDFFILFLSQPDTDDFDSGFAVSLYV